MLDPIKNIFQADTWRNILIKISDSIIFFLLNNVRLFNNKTYLMILCSDINSNNIIKQLINPKTINIISRRGNTALSELIYSLTKRDLLETDLDLIGYFLNNGADPNLTPKIYYRAAKKSLELLKLLMEYKTCDLESCELYYNAYLNCDDGETIRYLLDYFPINGEENQKNVLHVIPVTWRKVIFEDRISNITLTNNRPVNLNKLKLLLDNGADLNKVYGIFSPFELFYRNGYDKEVIELLLQYNPEFDKDVIETYSLHIWGKYRIDEKSEEIKNMMRDYLNPIIK